jgi:hypothetical protein
MRLASPEKEAYTLRVATGFVRRIQMLKVTALTVLSLVLFSEASFAKGRTVVCARPVQDASLTATFTNVGQANMKVSLFVPNGEFSGSRHEGRCRAQEGAIEASFTCTVFTSTDSGYGVSLYSIGGPGLTASVRSWNMQGQGRPEHLPCRQGRF